MENFHLTINSLRCDQKELEIKIWAYEFVEKKADEQCIYDEELLIKIGNDIVKNIRFLWGKYDDIDDLDNVIRKKAVEIWNANLN